MAPVLFPASLNDAGAAAPPETTRIEVVRDEEGFPYVVSIGVLAGESGLPLLFKGPGMPLLGDQARGLFERPHLRGHRLSGSGWTPRFTCTSLEVSEGWFTAEVTDPGAGLGVRTEAEALPGGGLRVRHTLTNDGSDDYHLEGLEVVLPVADRLTEVLDLTGRHERERSAQRHEVVDGVWLREGRTGRPGLEAASYVVVGTPGFGTVHGETVGVHVAWSGNSVLRVERSAASGTTVGGGELLLPGEVVLAPGESYATPWVMFAASGEGLDGVASQWHEWLRSLPSHADVQPVVLNVWEAVFFDHDLDRLKAIADRAARVGVERFVLDDGWFMGRRDDTAGLGDWEVDPAVWPDGLTPLVDHVHGLGMEFGLWFEPEMVNPDSDLYRAHPDWVLSSGDRVPLLHRDQLVLDLGRDEVWEHVHAQMDAVLSAYPVDYVKWDHNRDLLEPGSGDRGGAPGVHRQAEAHYRLLDRLRADHPGIAWESCAAGGGRIDLGVLSRVQRVWTSDMTDALARHSIQRWTTQLIAPEYAGAHVSAPTSHVTHRTFGLDFRSATAMFGAFGIEWDLTLASEEALDRLGEWVERHKRFRPLLHSGRMVRPESPDAEVLLHGVVAHDGREALIAHVQMDEPSHNRGVWVRVPGLDPSATFDLRWEGPVDLGHLSMSAKAPEIGPTGGTPVTGAALARQGFWIPRRTPESITLVHLTAE